MDLEAKFIVKSLVRSDEHKITSVSFIIDDTNVLPVTRFVFYDFIEFVVIMFFFIIISDFVLDCLLITAYCIFPYLFGLVASKSLA